MASINGMWGGLAATCLIYTSMPLDQRHTLLSLDQQRNSESRRIYWREQFTVLQATLWPLMPHDMHGETKGALAGRAAAECG